MERASMTQHRFWKGAWNGFASVMGKAGRLKFRVVRDGIVNFVEGDRVSFYVDSVLRFSGFVMTKERTSEQIISDDGV